MSNLSGQQLGHYTVLEPLGAGGMGVVYRARDTVLGRMVALKVLPATSSSDPEAVNRFRREARTASSLNHPNICTIYGFNEQDGRCYLAMELLEGETLDRRLLRGPLDPTQLLEVASQVADALDAAHGEHILHRDIKPANIFLTKRGQTKVLDFGLAKLAEGPVHRGGADTDEPTAEGPATFTSVVGTTVGTPAYMSPEQARAEDLDVRTDLFSFGVVLHEMATGRVSFPGNTTAVIFDGILNRDPTPASSLNPLVSPELDRIIAKALEKDRALRYQTAADLRADLQRLRRDSSKLVTVQVGGSRRPEAAALPTPGPGFEVAATPSLAGRQITMAVAPSAALTLATARSTHVTPPGAPPPAHAAATEVAPVSASLPIAPARSNWSVSITTAAVVLVMAAAVGLMLRRIGVTDTPAAMVGAQPVTPGTSDPAAAYTVPPAPVAPAASDTAAPPAKAPATPAMVTTSTQGTAPPPTTAEVANGEAATRLDIARAKLSSNLPDQAMADLREIVNDFPSSPAAADAAYVMAETFARLGRIDDAMAAHVEFAQRFSSDQRLADSHLALAELTLKSRQPNRDDAARASFGRAAAAAPGTPTALRALQGKASIEDRHKLKVRESASGKEVPASLGTLRMIADQFPASPHGMLALYRMGSGYADADQWELAARAWTDLATRYPENPNDAWWLLGDLYERRLRDDARAKAAYAQVPAT
ncbi:MAG TPA: serine/threonine-protein kinase, partial [Vicinamibacterales bacterium]|nr:serine/threonine-protein kinase [Vicinamibacterales bacterium]